MVYASVNHRFDARWSGRLTGQWQNSEFSNGKWDGVSESYFAVGLNLSYQFNRYLSGEVGYNYDDLYDSPVGRAYDRNRFYIGVTAAY